MFTLVLHGKHIIKGRITFKSSITFLYFFTFILKHPVETRDLEWYHTPNGAIFSDRYRALLRDMQKLFFLFLLLFKKAFACPKPLGRGF